MVDVNKFRDKAQSKEKFDRMVKLMENAGTSVEFGQVAMMYTMDMSYPRPDILLAMDYVKAKKGFI